MSTVKITQGQSSKYAVQGKRAKEALSRDEQDLYELCSLSGVQMSPAVFRIVLDLIKINVSPVAIVQMLKSMVHRSSRTPGTMESLSTLPTPSTTTGDSRNSSEVSTGASKQAGRIGLKPSKSGRTRLTGKTSQKPC